MSSADERALFHAVLDDPEDDLPRLAYADWLDEHGGETDHARAEFIRLQIELDGLERPPGPETTSHRKPLSARISALLKAHRKHWEAPLRGRKGPLRGRDASCTF